MKPPTLGLLPGTRLASTYFPPRCDLPRDGPHGPSHPGQISLACSRFSHLLKRNKTWDTSTTYLEMRGRCDELESRISALISHINPYISNMIGSGPVIAAELLVSIGENPGRIPSEAALAQLCGVAPLPASSGRTTRHRLNRGGDRRANSALYRI